MTNKNKLAGAPILGLAKSICYTALENKIATEDKQSKLNIPMLKQLAGKKRYFFVNLLSCV